MCVSPGHSHNQFMIVIMESYVYMPTRIFANYMHLSLICKVAYSRHQSLITMFLEVSLGTRLVSRAVHVAQFFQSILTSSLLPYYKQANNL